MKPISATESGVLRWSQTGRLDSQLFAGDGVVASLSWARDWSTHATAESAEARWSFRRVGLLHPKVVAKLQGTEDETAIASLSWRGAVVIETSASELFRLQQASLWCQEWALTDSRRKTLMSLRWNPSRTSEGVIVTLEQGSTLVEGLSLLNVLSWYLVLLVSHDYDGGAIAASVAAGAI